MASLKELRDVRISKLDRLKKLGIDPYPAISKKSITNNLVLETFESLENSNVEVTGRIFSIRKHGTLSFIDLRDASGSLQIVLKEENLKEFNPKYSELNYENLDLLDT